MYFHENGQGNIWCELLWSLSLDPGCASRNESEAERAYHQQQQPFWNCWNTVCGSLLLLKVCPWRPDRGFSSDTSSVQYQVKINSKLFSFCPCAIRWYPRLRTESLLWNASSWLKLEYKRGLIKCSFFAISAVLLPQRTTTFSVILV